MLWKLTAEGMVSLCLAEELSIDPFAELQQ